MRSLVIGVALMVSGVALACGGQTCAKCSDAHANVKEVSHSTNPTACAKRADLVGSACSYATGMMAQRVVSEGQDVSYQGTLAKVSAAGKSRIATPYSIGPKASMQVIANEILEEIVERKLTDKALAFKGKMLEVEGIQYFVLLGYQDKTS